ncbi:hypothetical protein ASG52_14045 [Methylobacterium sp. Leaf456]|uniref:hypothetical protein n=1 Tax=Methylobacterium sp. Leaf456 TaxID=1736382 RepID=UPI0006FEA9DF|nr:hypothetical protein [Methylobacterium sp. Leaf456]KQT46817.1 hypothetical protein ASG52_14045 [Methylobacterium sp. Leaf456]
MVVSLAWYRPEDYRRILSIMKDADALPETYEAWLKSARNVEAVTQRGAFRRSESSSIPTNSWPIAPVKGAIPSRARAVGTPPRARRPC